MSVRVLALACLLLSAVALVTGQEEQTTSIPIGDCVGRDEELRSTVTTLARQMMLQQLFVEENSRSDGDSGLKAVRQTRDGTHPYHVNSHMSYSVASMHDHADHEYTVGMGELLGVLNGVEFRTRHNDYSLMKPSSSSSDYHASERIDYMDVPPAVTGTVEEQIQAMREWFKAWITDSTSPRDYREYFKPMLCYMEGAWTSTSDGELWFDLQEKIRYTAYHGSKDNGENLAYLPITIISINETTGVPVFAQFNYRIMCHPIEQEVKLKYFRPAKDLHARFAAKKSLDEYQELRAARFRLSEFDNERFHRWTNILDRIMSEIPGKDNYGGSLTDNTFGLSTADVYTGDTLNSAYYHRWYLMQENGAMGSNIGHRGFNDRNLYVAENTRPQVAGVDYNYCSNPRNDDTCVLQSKKVSYAFPLEVVWLTPLNKWNPYNLVHRGRAGTDEADVVTDGGRNGGFTASRAFSGIHSKTYYMTPSSSTAEVVRSVLFDIACPLSV
ncbi:hypothetical protein RRG08_044518 [Elysia crispata]|uniref:Uncharacterized protein n=1 Tax=Elysia crispata TaxID=231223 RepID=A0AAE0ZBC6_9GAST|nr:hypothetical protein RRG08_044518 [Elysia crispata]